MLVYLCTLLYVSSEFINFFTHRLDLCVSSVLPCVFVSLPPHLYDHSHHWLRFAPNAWMETSLSSDDDFENITTYKWNVQPAHSPIKFAEGAAITRKSFEKLKKKSLEIWRLLGSHLVHGQIDYSWDVVNKVLCHAIKGLKSLPENQGWPIPKQIIFSMNKWPHKQDCLRWLVDPIGTGRMVDAPSVW